MGRADTPADPVAVMLPPVLLEGIDSAVRAVLHGRGLDALAVGAVFTALA
ncbi:hypothetical protein Kpho02_77350 [Kitasatospora phosalacinea]|uniref:Uncharacterized protein n=1 Tax=Kitasatospora phosalacinea TaxID=2065 RepID=A0A9W6V6M0_9ACTN|nr:hypothetical protein Kpho02_77350 [Kitasatospora phosalacinea]